MIKKSSAGKSGVFKTTVLSQDKKANNTFKPFDTASFCSEENSRKIKKIVEKYDLELVLLFGSQASGKTHFASDIDIAILGQKMIIFEDEMKIRYEFTKVLKTDGVDIVDIRRAGPLLMYQIFSKPHKILFCTDLQIYFRYKIYAERKFVEAKPIFDLTQYSIERFLQKHGK